jgi:hypothetical protein
MAGGAWPALGRLNALLRPPIVLGEPDGPHMAKIAMEGAAHMALVFGAFLAWRAPLRARDVLLLMIFLNGLWTLTDLV